MIPFENFGLEEGRFRNFSTFEILKQLRSGDIIID